MENSELLNELRIDRGAAAPPSRKPWGIVLAVLVIAALGLGVWFAFGGTAAAAVKTATAQPMTNAAASATSVLDATG